MDMNDVLGLVRQGRLADATRRIQERLGGGETESGAAGREMKDVTPRPKALSGPAGATPGAPKRAKARRAAPPPSSKPRFRARPFARSRGGSAPSLPEGGEWLTRTGALPHRLFVPPAPRSGAPLIVMLHGCTQTPEDFSAGTRMNHAAAGIGAHVLWPEQVRGANANLCWNWFEPAHQGRGGEPGAIARVIEGVRGELGAGSVHVAGLSAGGAMAAVLGARFPELVASVGIHSGLAVGSASDVPSAFAAMGQGGAAGAALACPAIVFQGEADRTVAPRNADAFGGTGGRRVSEGGRSAQVFEGTGPGGHAAEIWRVEGLAHAWSGGDAAGSHSDPAGPDATAHMLRFFAAQG